MRATYNISLATGWSFLWAALLLFAEMSCAWGQIPAGADQPFTLSAAPNVDEELFLVSVLEDTYLDWPGPQQARESAQWIAQTRQDLRFLRSTIDAHRVSRDVAQLYDDALQLLQAYEQYAINIGAINQQTVEDAGQGVAEAGVKSALAMLWQVIQNNSSEEVSKAGKEKAIDSLTDKGVEIFFARQKALSAEEQKLQTQLRVTLSDSQTLAARLTRDLGWRFGEVDFSDWDASHLDTWVAQRARDPFVLCRAARRGVEQERTASGLVNRAAKCVQAAMLVPDGGTYAGYRAQFMAYAVWMGLDGVSREQGTYTGLRSSNAAPALRLVRTYLALEPDDAGGFGHMELARALAFTGRYDEALLAAEASARFYNDDPVFLYRYAKLLSLHGDTSAAENTLRRALNRGYTDIRWLRTDPDFSGLRRARPEQFENLTTIRIRSQISWGMLLDDIVLHNDSEFPLTDLAIDLQIVQGNQRWTVSQENCTSIAAHGTCTISNAVSIPDSRFDRTNLTYSCDQAPEQVAENR